MKRICITYQLSRMTSKPSDDKQTSDIVENCITTSIKDDMANELLLGIVPTAVQIWLNNLAELQGYHNATFCSAELA